MSVFIFIFTLCFLVLFHELGHFLMARIFHVAIDTFSIGFGKALLSYTSKKHQTEFRIAPIFLGGYVRFAEDLSHHPSQVLIGELSLWRQLCILLAGPFANLLLAFLALVVFFKLGSYSLLPYVGDLENQSLASQIGFVKGQRILAVNDHQVNSWDEVMNDIFDQRTIKFTVIDVGAENKHDLFYRSTQPLEQDKSIFSLLGFKPLQPLIPAIVGSVQKKSVADMAGIAEGDKIISIDGINIHHMAQLSEYVRTHPDSRVGLRWVHGSQQISKNILLQSRLEQQKRVGLLGVTSVTLDKFPQWFHYNEYSWGSAFSKAIKTTWDFLSVQLKIWAHFHEQVGNVSGPIGMAKAADHAWSAGFKMYLIYVVWLNIGLAIINLLPIPILDGGQCVILVLKKCFPKLFTEQFSKFINICSFTLLVGLFFLGLVNDWPF